MIISDSKLVVSWVNGEGFGNFNLVHLIYDILAFLRKFPGNNVVFKSRSSNSFADNLAKMGSRRVSDRLEWSEF